MTEPGGFEWLLDQCSRGTPTMDAEDAQMIDRCISVKAESCGIDLDDPAIVRAVTFGALLPRSIHSKIPEHPLRNREGQAIRVAMAVTFTQQRLIALYRRQTR